MPVVLWVPLAIIALGAGYWFARKRRHGRRAARDVLRRVFRRREYRELDARLERIAVDELRRLEISAKRYIAGDVGYVVVISDSRHGIGLGLSDGRRLELGGVSRSTLRQLEWGAAEDRLRPAHVTRDSFSYRLLLRGESGTEMEVFARRITLAL
jgi:hypothetical protein